MAKYNDSVLKQLKDLMNEHGPTALRGHWGIGDPVLVPQNQLPAAFLQYDNVYIDDSSNATLEFKQNIVITVSINQKRGNSVFADDVASHSDLVELVLARDSAMNVLDSCILGVLRKYQDANTGKSWIDPGTETAIEFGQGREARGPGIMTAEAIIRFQFNSEQLNPEYY